MKYYDAVLLSKKTYVLLFVVILCLAASSVIEGASTITITPSTKFQTMDGLGCYLGQGYSGTPVFMHDSLGITMARLRIWPSLQSSNNMTDSTNSDMTKFSVGAQNEEIRVLNSMKAYTDVKYFASCMSPPGWMKDMTNDAMTTSACSQGATSNLCGGHLMPKYYESYAGFICGFLKIIKAQTGVNIFAVSFQNECYFLEPYQSCVYTPQEYVAMHKVLGARLKKEGLPTTLIGAEDMAANINDAGRTYAMTINNDPVAKPYLYAVAVHGYVDGIRPIASSSNSQIWTRAGNIAVVTMGKKLWMTETSGFAQNTWTDAIGLAGGILATLKYGQLSGYTYWHGNDCTTEGLACNNAHTMLSLVSKNYYKFIRPGAVSVGCVNTGDELFPVAFTDAVNKTMTIVIVNSATAARQLTLASSSALPATFTKYTTTSAKRCVNEGSVSSTATIAIDANSVTTLFAQNYGVNISDREAIHHSFLQIDKKECGWFRIDGSSVKGRAPSSRGVLIKAVKENGNLTVTPVAMIVK
jgi:O-glycosyl hydrolase